MFWNWKTSSQNQRTGTYDGSKKIGELASLNDELIKKILEGEKIKGIFETIKQSNKLMEDLMRDSTVEIDDLKQTIKTKYAEFFD